MAKITIPSLLNLKYLFCKFKFQNMNDRSNLSDTKKDKY